MREDGSLNEADGGREEERKKELSEKFVCGNRLSIWGKRERYKKTTRLDA